MLDIENVIAYDDYAIEIENKENKAMQQFEVKEVKDDVFQKGYIIFQGQNIAIGDTVEVPETLISELQSLLVLESI